jgi:O-antigen/teichoic acid export membrane protein
MFMISDNETQIKLLYTMIMFTTNKLTSIPQVLAPGFSIAIIPFITASYERNDMIEVRRVYYGCLKYGFISGHSVKLFVILSLRNLFTM